MFNLALQFLETGSALYILAGVCFFGILFRVMTGNLYRRLIKESGNMTLTKNRHLKDLKQRLETTYRSNQGIRDTRSYLECQMYRMKFGGLTLGGWNNLCTQMTLLSVMAGGAGAFLSYWYRLDSYYIVLYASMGVLFALLTMMFDVGAGTSNERWMQLVATLQDYVDNVLFMRLAKSLPDDVGEEAEVEAAPAQAREIARPKERGTSRSRTSTREAAREAARESVRDGGREVARESARETAKERFRDAEREVREFEPEPGSRKNPDYLKQSLEQIAASRDRGRDEDNWLKELNPEELQLISEIIREYLV